MKEMSELQMQFCDALVYGHIEEALSICKLYDIPLTKQLCVLFEDAAKGMLQSSYRNIIKSSAIGVLGFQHQHLRFKRSTSGCRANVSLSYPRFP